MVKREQLFVGLRFDLPTRPGHYFRLESFARPAKPGETPKWTDRIDGKITHFVPCGLSEATHVKGWESYGCLLTIDRLLNEGTIKPDNQYQERWAFTHSDLDDPTNIKRDDTFLAFPDDVDEGVYVDRRGLATGQYGDGAFGVTKDDADEAFNQDEIHRVISESEGFGRNLEASVRWKEVLCSAEGDFLGFAE